MTKFEPTATPPRTADFLLTVLLILIELVVVVLLALSALAVSLSNLGCSTEISGCDPTKVQIGQLLATWGPSVIAIATAIIAVVRVLRRKIAFWLPLLGIALMVGVFLLGRLIMGL
jgi:hypothetical protein